MKKWYQKITVPVLLIFSIIACLAGPVAVIKGKAETGDITVTAEIDSKKINKKTYTMKEGSNKKINLSITPQKAKAKINYQSSKKNIVSIGKTGVLEAKKEGTAKITITVTGKENQKQKIWFKVKVMKKNNLDNKDEIPITIIIGEEKFEAKFYNNKTTKELVKKMPMTLSMEELNGNEKYYYFDTELPTEKISPKQIEAGDIKLYGSDCLVLFYKTHTTSYQYTSVGYIEDISGFVKAAGEEDIEITFQKE